MNEPHEPMRMPFGKFKGELLENIPTDYIEWALENVALENVGFRYQALEKELQNQLEMRQGKGVKR